MRLRRSRLPRPELTDPSLFEGDARIVCRNVRKQYLRQAVLDDVDLTVKRGSMVGLIGPGGAGKSLLVKIVCGLVEADEGTVEVDGVDMRSLGEAQLQSMRGRIGMVFQNYALFDFMNVGENIALPLRTEARTAGREVDEADLRERVAAILEPVALPGIEAKMPTELSGGMKKRVSFARAVITEPEIIVYDDPTAGLDPVTSAKIYELLEATQARGVTSVTISHDLDGIRPLCDAWVLMDKGRVVFEGTTAEIEASQVRLVRQFWHGED